MSYAHPVLLSISIAVLSASLASAQPAAPPVAPHFQVVLLGTAGGPTINPDRSGISTLIIAGNERLVFDLGRNAMSAFPRLGITSGDVTKVFFTHLHSDHVVDLPAFLLFPWASQGRSAPLEVWGPTGTRQMTEHLVKAFAFDIQVRQADERFPASGIQVKATDVKEGVAYQANGVTVRAFLVDHGPVAPALGYRIDYAGHSVVISGDTMPSDNLVKQAKGVDVLIHELGRWKKDPALNRSPDELMPNSRLASGQTLEQLRAIIAHHTDGEEAGRIFARVAPKLAVFSHYNVAPASALPLVRQNYPGPVEFGEDLMTIDIDDAVSVRRFITPRAN